jgi:hypothetical protein
MPLTPAERQARYRARTKATTARLNTPISLEAKQALERLTELQGITQQAALEQALLYTLEHLEQRP